MKKLIEIFPEMKELSKQIYNDFEKKLSCSKLQVNVFENIINNIYPLQIQTGVSIYYFDDEEDCVEIINPFMNSNGTDYVNPFKEYSGFENSNFIDLIEEIKLNVNEKVSELYISSFVFNKSNQIKEIIKSKYGKYFDKYITCEFEFNIFE